MSINRGEQAATALEANLSKLESRLDELLAGLEALEEPRGEDMDDSAVQPGQQASRSSRADERKD